MKSCLRLMFVSLAACWFVPLAWAEDSVSGSAYALDGDTIVVEHVKVRLHGLDAPEMKTCWGKWSRLAMDRLVVGKTVRCELSSKKSYDRIVGACFVGALSLTEEMIRQGWGIEHRSYSTEYIGIELEAAQNRRGVWGTKC